MLARRLLTLMIAVAVTLAASSTEAQRFRYRRGGVIVRTPGVGVVVGPGGVSVNTPYGAYGYGGPVVYGAPVVVDPYQPPGVAVDVSPALAGSPPPVVVSKPAVEYATSEPQTTQLSEAQLMGMLANASTQLSAELSTLDGGDAWQRYLALPQGTALRGVEGQKFAQLLTRFDAVAREPRFRVIAGLAGFIQTHAVLREAVDRLQNANRDEQPELKLTAPTPPSTEVAKETLPTPAAEQAIGPTPAGPEPSEQPTTRP